MSQATKGEQKAQNVVSELPSIPISSSFQKCNADCVLKVTVNEVPTSCLVDTGAVSTILSKSLWDKLEGGRKQLIPANLQHNLVGAQGTPLIVLGAGKVELQLGGQVYPADVIVAETLTTDLILGRDFFKQHQCSVELGKKDLLHLTKAGVTLSLGSDTTQEVASMSIVAEQTLCIPPLSELEIMAQVPKADFDADTTWLVESKPPDGGTAVAVARAVVSPRDKYVPLRVLNPRDEPVSLSKGQEIARMEPLPRDPPGAVAAIGSPDLQQAGSDGKKKAILWDLVTQAQEKLSTQEQEQLFATLLTFSDVFSVGPDDLGRTNQIKHGINTGDTAPIRQQVRRIPPILREESNKLLKEMLGKDVIRPSASPWASPIVLVRKKDGSTRFCVDYRKVNHVTRKDAYPLPRVDDTLDTLSGAKWFSTLDLICGYWQVEVDEKDRAKTAFCTPDGLFEFNVMPFGLCNAPATFQRLMDLVLAGLQWSSCLVYLDDVIVIGKTFKEHLSNLHTVLTRLREAGLKLKPKKCALCLP